jgi:hypothetical protein
MFLASFMTPITTPRRTPRQPGFLLPQCRVMRRSSTIQMIRKHNLLTICVILVSLQCSADADQRQVLDIDPVNLCEFVSRAGNNWRPEDEIRSDAQTEAEVKSGDGIEVANLAPRTTSVPICDLYPKAYQCAWHFADVDAASSKYRSVLAELQACVSQSETWTDSELHPQTCTTRLLPSSLMQEQVQSQDQETDPSKKVFQGFATSLYDVQTTPHFSERSIEGMILHHHGSDEAVTLGLDLASTLVVGGFNPKATLHSFSTRLSIIWAKYDDIDPEVCAEYRKRRAEELNRAIQFLNQAGRPTGDSDSNEDSN